MIRAVLDANVFVSALLSPKGLPSKILAVWRAERFHLVTSPAILEEIGRVLQYPKIALRHRWPRERIRLFMEDLARLAILTPGERTLDVIAEDPSDNRYLECAVEGDADYIGSGDQHLLQLVTYEKIRVLTPSEFLTVLARRTKL
jgi:putative PIN family toxin of toxin-antitoxin system